MIVGLLASAALLAGCSSDGSGAADLTAPSGSPSAATPSASESAPVEGSGRFPQYVALGDSYTAAPLVPQEHTSPGLGRVEARF